MMTDKSDDKTQDEAWKNKVRSLDDKMKALRSGAPQPKGKAKPEPPAKEPGRGLFGRLHPRHAP